MRTTLSLAGMVLCLCSASSGAAEIRGQYLEARTCDVYTGPCFANAEMVLGGKEAVMAWNVEEGGWQGTGLEGLSVALVVKAEGTLGNDGVFADNAGGVQSLILVDDRASTAQQAALVAFVKDTAADYTKNVQEVQRTPMEFSNDHHTVEGVFKAGKMAEIKTRKLGDRDCVCTNEQTFYQPLVDVKHATPAYSLTQSFTGRGLDGTWTAHNTRSSYLAVFRR